MRYLHLQRRSKAFITMGAYIKEKQPEIFALLLKYIFLLGRGANGINKQKNI